jgi:hypothetical protein
MLNNVALYSKHHYQRSGNIWFDIQKCIEADDYTPMSCCLEDAIERQDFEQAARIREEGRDNIICVLVNEVSPIIPNGKEYMMHEFLEATDKRSCWKNGYYHNEFWGKNNYSKEEQDKLEPYDYKTAVLYFFLSKLSNSTVVDLGWELGNPPKASSKVLPLRKSYKEEMAVKK